jgi:hypothetical protein
MGGSGDIGPVVVRHPHSCGMAPKHWDCAHRNTHNADDLVANFLFNLGCESNIEIHASKPSEFHYIMYVLHPLMLHEPDDNCTENPSVSHSFGGHIEGNWSISPKYLAKWFFGK